MSTEQESFVTPTVPARRRQNRTRSRRVSDSDSDYEEEAVSRKPRIHARTNKSDHHPRRRLKSAQQLSVLQEFFDHNTKPSKEEINELAENTSLSFQEIQRWFRNERHKHKKAHNEEYEESAPSKKSPRRKRGRNVDSKSSAEPSTTNKRQRGRSSDAQEDHDSSPSSSPQHGDDHHDEHSTPPHSPTVTPMVESPDSSPRRPDSPEPHRHPHNVDPTADSTTVIPTSSVVTIAPLTVPQQLASLLRRVVPSQPFLPQPSPRENSTEVYELPLPLDDPFSPMAPSDVDAISNNPNFSWDMLTFADHISNKDFVDLYMDESLPLLNNFTLSSLSQPQSAHSFIQPIA